jgi:hypothetical protein
MSSMPIASRSLMLYSEPPNAIAILGKRLNDEAEKIARLIISP